ncbi:UDP-2-acetamido-2-deoxy-3-oxo-D-glucuronate aminotransferase [Candidatus Magnetaquicoccaceae bacterium FCR-1]|uniref:UDP-2-acetamido-2-deoxy-3-oxo-D-glucuronate aminotransferase n=1 Tax=Candidatus Magnetaquiglobus chichijimensis TaxID=3141448 RepID=A0ABQ0CC23_9PROT
MEFIDLQTQYRAMRDPINQAIQAVLDSSRYINGPQVKELETALAAFVGCDHAVGFSSGTDALLAILMAKGIGPGDEVITTPFTFIATAETIALTGAKPLFVDVEPDTLNIDPNRIEAAITPRTKAIMPVSIFGQCADLDAINAIAAAHDLWVLEDACQSFGAANKGRRSCSMTTAAATSFFPAKPLGCYGDGGMAFTRDAELAQQLRVIREHGQIAQYQHAVLGINGRLDSIQAAILLAKLPCFEGEIQARQQVAARYAALLGGKVRIPVIRPENVSVFAQYTIRIAGRDQVRATLAQAGIPTAVHYPIPLHHQAVFAGLGHAREAFPNATLAANEVISLPMHPYLTAEQQEAVAQAVLSAVA